MIIQRLLKGKQRVIMWFTDRAEELSMNDLIVKNVDLFGVIDTFASHKGI